MEQTPNGLVGFQGLVADACKAVVQMGVVSAPVQSTVADAEEAESSELAEHKNRRQIYFDQHILEQAYTTDNQEACMKAAPFFPSHLPFDYTAFVDKGVNSFLLYMGRSTRNRYIPSAEQLRVLYSCAPRLLIDSGPGTGKTTTIIRKAFIEQNVMGLNAEDILAFTYTEAGVQSMNNSYNNLMTEFSSTRYLEFRTIHSWCKRFLDIYVGDSDVISEVSGATISTWDEEAGEYFDTEVNMYSLIMECMESAGINTKMIGAGTMHSIITVVTERNITTDEELRSVENLVDVSLTINDIITVKNLYKIQKRNLGLIDFNDMLEDARDVLVRILEGRFEIRNELQATFCKYKSIYVDEFQDITPLQLEIISLLVEINRPNNVRLTCIGDIDQGIYSFKGADIRNILRFVEDYRNDGLDVVFLTQNRRSVETVIELGNHIIQKNELRFPKLIRGMANKPKYGGSVSAWVDPNGGIARGLIKDRLLKEWGKVDKNMNQFAIMYRDNKQLTPYVNMLMQYRIPFCTKLDDRRQINYTPFMEEVKDILGLIDLLTAPANPDLVYRWLPKMVQYMSKEAAQKISFELRGNSNAKLVGILKREGKYQKSIDKMVSLRGALLDEKTSPSQFLVLLIEHYREVYYNFHLSKGQRGVKGGNQDDSGNDKEQAGKGKKQNNLPYVTEYLTSRVQGSKLEYLRGRVEEDKIWLKTNSNNVLGVNLTTFSSSKGLEYQNTYILPFPGVSKVQPRYEKLSDYSFQMIQEEARRLFYVAVTRTINNLVYFYEPPMEGFNLQNVCQSNIFTEDIVTFLLNKGVAFGPRMTYKAE